MYQDDDLGVLDGGQVGIVEGWTRKLVTFAAAADSEEWGVTVRGISLGPESEADAVIIRGPSCPEGMVVTTQTPFTGLFIGPFVILPYYDPTTSPSTPYGMEVFLWTKPREMIPPTYIQNTINAARRIFSSL